MSTNYGIRCKQCEGKGEYASFMGDMLQVYAQIILDNAPALIALGKAYRLLGANLDIVIEHFYIKSLDVCGLMDFLIEHDGHPLVVTDSNLNDYELDDSEINARMTNLAREVQIGTDGIPSVAIERNAVSKQLKICAVWRCYNVSATAFIHDSALGSKYRQAVKEITDSFNGEIKRLTLAPNRE